MSDITPAVLEHYFSFMRDNPTWQREHEIIYAMWDEIERLRGLFTLQTDQDAAHNKARIAEWDRERELLSAEIERLRGLSDITRLDVMWQELVKERYAAENNAAILAAEVQNLRSEIVRLRRGLEPAWEKANLDALEIERLHRLIAEKDTQLSQIPCRYNRCIEYAETKAEIERLRDKLVEYMNETQSKASEIERLREVLHHVVNNPWDYDTKRVREALGE